MAQIDEASWLEFDRRHGETLRAALERSLRDAIRSGALREGVQIPSSRRLAAALGVSRGVVSDAYAQLEAQGFLVVSPRAAPVVGSAGRARAPRTEARPGHSRLPRYDFSPTTPDVTLFPVNRWLAAADSAARRAPTALLDYGPPRGERVLRELLADRLGRTRGVIAEPDQIVVVQGTAQGVDLLLRLLRARGATRIAVEDPSHTTQCERIALHGLEVVPRPLDRDGIVVAGIEADAVLVTPAHQFPTGCVLSGSRRRELLEWANRTGGLILEDDYDSEFRYDREPIRALQGLAPNQVVQLGTVSKTLAPALRLGWVVVPIELADGVAALKRLVDDFTPALDQLALAEFMRRGDYDRHVRRARAVYRRRRDRLIAAVARYLPGLPVEGVAAGVHLLVRLPPGVDDEAVAETARAARIAVSPLSSFRVRPAADGGLVIGYGRLHEASVEPAVRALARIVQAQR